MADDIPHARLAEVTMPSACAQRRTAEEKASSSHQGRASLLLRLRLEPLLVGKRVAHAAENDRLLLACVHAAQHAALLELLDDGHGRLVEGAEALHDRLAVVVRTAARLAAHVALNHGETPEVVAAAHNNAMLAHSTAAPSIAPSVAPSMRPSVAPSGSPSGQPIMAKLEPEPEPALEPEPEPRPGPGPEGVLILHWL